MRRDTDNLAKQWRQHEEVGAEEGRRKDAETVLKGSAVNILGKFGRLSKSLCYIGITRFMGAEVLGLYTLGWSLIDLFSKFGLFGLDRGGCASSRSATATETQRGRTGPSARPLP